MSKEKQLIRPYFTSLRLEATSHCNMRCKYCFAEGTMSERKGLDMPISEINRILDMAREHKIRKVLYSGGEPFVRKDFIQVLRNSYDIKTSFVTNGTLINTYHYEEISKLKNVNRIRFSIDGFSGHDSMRIGSNWQSVVKSIENCRQNLPQISIVAQATATPDSVKEIPDLLVLLNKIGVDRFRLYFLRFSGVVAEGSVELNCQYYRDYVETLCKIAELVESGSLKGTQIETDGGFQSDLDFVTQNHVFPNISSDTHPCNYLLHILMIRSNGDIAICPFFEKAIGNIRDFKSISEVQNHLPLVGWRNLQIKELDGCEDCRYMKICKGGCRKTAFVLEGNGRAKDPVLCFLMPLLENQLWHRLSKITRDHYISQLNSNGFTPEVLESDLDTALQSLKGSTTQF